MKVKVAQKPYWENKELKTHDLKGQVLDLGNMKLNVELDLNPQIKVHSEGICSTTLRELETGREFFVSANWLKLERIKWMYEKQHFQVNWKWYISVIIIPFFGGLGFRSSGIIAWIYQLIGN